MIKLRKKGGRVNGTYKIPMGWIRLSYYWIVSIALAYELVVFIDQHLHHYLDSLSQLPFPNDVVASNLLVPYVTVSTRVGHFQVKK